MGCVWQKIHFRVLNFGENSCFVGGRILIWVLLLLCFSSFCLGVLCFVLSFFKVLWSFFGSVMVFVGVGCFLLVSSFLGVVFSSFFLSKLPRFLDLVIDCVCVVCFFLCLCFLVLF